MARIIVFQHVAYEPLGTLDPLIRSQKHRVRYVNFGRTPNAIPSIEGYDALIVLGGPMNIGEEKEYPHLETEKRLIKQAIERDMAVLGICLGAQLIAAAMGAKVYKAEQSEIGWYPMNATEIGGNDPVVGNFDDEEKIFQWHGFTFDLPPHAELLVKGRQLPNQAFRIKHNVYGFQFHLEANGALIERWLNLPSHRKELGLEDSQNKIEDISERTVQVLDRSLQLSQQVFAAFLQLLPAVKGKHHFCSR
jgi:GMP synthase (glutamine-hydrolysing)